MRSSVAATGQQRDAELTGSEAWLKEQLDTAGAATATGLSGSKARPRASAHAKHPTPASYTRIGLVASASLCQGPTSPLAALVRELTPYLVEHTPHLYALEGTYRTILSCGLLRGYPPARLHCLAPRRIGGMVDIGAGLVGKDVTGLAAAFGPKHAVAAARLDLDYELDCLIHLLDPMQATSALPATLTIKRECAIANKPLFDNLASAVEWFGLVGSLAGGSRVSAHLLDPELRSRLGYEAFPHRAISLVSVDAKKAEMLDFVRMNLPFLQRFETRSGTASTAALLNGDMKIEQEVNKSLDDKQRAALSIAARKLRAALGRAGIEDRWITELRSGTEGGYIQIAESLSMGLTDSALFFRDPRAPDLQDGAELLDRAPLMTNYADRLSDASGHMLMRDARSASQWAKLWTSMPEGSSPASVTAAFREVLDVQLVLAEPREDPQAQWDAITEEAAWFLVSAIAAKSAATARGGQVKRITVACGAAMRKVIADIRDPVAFDLADRVTGHHKRHAEAVNECKRLFPHRARLVELIARRKRLSLEARSTSPATLWPVGSATVAPMVGMFGSTRRTNEANYNARLLADLLEGNSLALAASAYVSGPSEIPDPIAKHWAWTDFLLLACADLSEDWFGTDGRVALPSGMHDDLVRKGAVGEIAGLYLDAQGQEVVLNNYVRHGMTLAHMTSVARGGYGGASIMIAGALRPSGSAPPNRIRTVLAAIRAGAVSVLVTDLTFARVLLEAYADDLPVSGASINSRTRTTAVR